VVMITSAGCNALDYVLDLPAEIHAVDVNSRQNALLQLKLSSSSRAALPICLLCSALAFIETLKCYTILCSKCICPVTPRSFGRLTHTTLASQV
jgi:hypothetical protein